MNADAEKTPTDPGTDVEQHIIDTAATDLATVLRSVRGASRRVQYAGPEERPSALADTREFIRTASRILDQQAALLEQVARRDAITQELAAAKDPPRGWFAFINGAVAVLSGSAAVGGALQGHPYAALAIAGITVLSAYFANTPLPFMRGERKHKTKGTP